VLVVRADPDFQRLKHRQLEYEFSNRRRFYADRDVGGPAGSRFGVRGVR